MLGEFKLRSHDRFASSVVQGLGSSNPGMCRCTHVARTTWFLDLDNLTSASIIAAQASPDAWFRCWTRLGHYCWRMPSLWW